jgi:hypothetical protein
MPTTTVRLPMLELKTITCPSCHVQENYTVISKQWPHAYCTYCHNAYVELGNHPGLKKISTNWGAKKAMAIIEGEAQLCTCGGMFLFKTLVHCIHCGEPLPITIPTEAHDRLRHSDLIIFNDGLVIYDNGTAKRFRFEI